MKFSHFFIDRPIFAAVLSFFIVLFGGIAYFILPVAQYPEIALPTVVVRASYPGATASTIAETVATPIEQEINGVEGMLYMESQSTADGSMQLTVTFELGTNLDDAQVLVQNRVAIAEPRLPEEVRRIGVTTRKSSPDLLLVIHLYSPDNSRSGLYVSNYANLRIRDALARLDGVGDVTVFGAREYAMRVWLDIEKMATLDLTAGDVVRALREQNIQVAAGAIGQPPAPQQDAFQLNISTLGRLKDTEQFHEIIVKSGEDGRLVRLDDIARIELGARDYSVNSYLDGQEAVGLGIFQRPGSNAVGTAKLILDEMEKLSKDFPPGMTWDCIYNPTRFVEESIKEVFDTLYIAGVLVALTVFVFLQGWRATAVPLIAIPISLIGTFAAMLGLGFSLNNLSLFGLVLAIGIVVDDAIVVVENVERLIDDGMEPRAATRKAMEEVGSALIATTLVLVAVFVPTSFLPGISGQFYRQFALTITFSTCISTFVSLTLSPAMCALLLKPRGEAKGIIDRTGDFLFGWFFKGFNRVFDVSSSIYARIVRRVLRASVLALIVYAGLLGLTWFSFGVVPTGFIPPQDQGYLIVSLELPPGSSLERTDEVARQVKDIGLETPGVAHAVQVVGFSGATRTNNSNAGAVFLTLEDARERAAKGQSIDSLLGALRQKMAVVKDAQIFVIAPPPVPGIGTGGGFKMQIQDQAGLGIQTLNQVAQSVAAQGNEQPGLVQVYSTFRPDTPQLYADIDRTKVRMLDVPLSNVFEALQVYLGSIYVNDFNWLGRTFQVTAQADFNFRRDTSDVLRLRTRSNNGAIIPLGSLLEIRQIGAPDRVVRYNLFPAADVNGETLPGTSTGQAIAAMEAIAEKTLPNGISYEWTNLSYQEKAAGNTAVLIFPLCVLFVFLALSAQYESWLLPLAVILIVPLSLLFAVSGLWLRGMDNNILAQIGFVVLIGLACKNAILIVEFAKLEEDAGRNRFEAAVEACRLRLRPILMTAFSFILGVIPLLFATGAGSEMRRSLGTAVFSGMLGVTIFGLFLTPVFYVVLRRFARDKAPVREEKQEAAVATT